MKAAPFDVEALQELRLKKLCDPILSNNLGVTTKDLQSTFMIYIYEIGTVQYSKEYISKPIWYIPLFHLRIAWLRTV